MGLRVGVLFGGLSAEHEISCLSAKNIYKALLETPHTPVLIGIDRQGLWHLTDDSFTFGQGISLSEAVSKILPKIDVAFPIFHGPYGEDGSFQGFLEILGIPYAGAGVLASAVGMDKDVMKRLLQNAGIPVADFLTFSRPPNFADVKAKLGLPLFIKPVTMGSSIGISRVTTEEEFIRGVEDAFQYDSRIIIEREVKGREIECSVLGGSPPTASLPGEFVPKGGVYTYEMKYLDPEGAAFYLPAPLSASTTAAVQSLAIKAFEVLATDGMARVDFFVDKGEKLYINEINTIPGFTPISLYPKLWELSGLSTPKLVERLIELGVERSLRKKSLSLEPNPHAYN
ncbi:MAG: D-alanine--D-alanine ligase [Verrucomicrobia bacterium]|nr:D-alanine--D-alanine ligase [Verrucomicrobiota bacterium]